MFLSEMSEAKQELIEIKDFDGDAIQDLVHFVYSSKLTLTVDNVQPLLYAACILQVKPARTRCVCVAFLLFLTLPHLCVPSRWSWWREPAAST